MEITWNNFSNILTVGASAATAVGVVLAVIQLHLTRKQSITTFEDGIALQYREIIANLALPALFGEPISDKEQESLLPHFYRYFDLCNEQVFLERHGRISKATWIHWKEGIVTNMKRPAFSSAWVVVASRALDDFSELRFLCPPISQVVNSDSKVENSK